MEKLNKIKIVLTGASGKPYKFDAKVKGETNASSIFRKLKKIVSAGTKSAVYFSFTISEYTDTMIKYDIISYGYVDDLSCYLNRFNNLSEGNRPVYIAFHMADKNVCPSIICDIINASRFNAANEHSAEIHQSW